MASSFPPATWMTWRWTSSPSSTMSRSWATRWATSPPSLSTSSSEGTCLPSSYRYAWFSIKVTGNKKLRGVRWFEIIYLTWFEAGVFMRKSGIGKKWFLASRFGKFSAFMENFWCRSNHDLKGLNIIYHLTHSDDYLCYLILHGKPDEKKNQKKIKHPNTKFLNIFQTVGTIIKFFTW